MKDLIKKNHVKQRIMCSLCGLKKSQFLFQKNGMEIIRCKNCGFVFAQPSLILSEIVGLYAQNEKQKRELYEDAKQNKIRVKIFRRLKSKGNLLDIGCGYGSFLKEASTVYKCIGVDISPSEVKFAGQKLRQTAIEGNIYDASLPMKWFDMITLIRVIEHLTDASEILALVNRVMKKDGLLFIKTGNIDSRKARKMGREWGYIDPPSHLLYFSKKSITHLLKKSGFRVLKITPGNLDISRVLGYFAQSSKSLFFSFFEYLISFKEFIKGNCMMDIYAQKVLEL